ncbi:Protease 3 precursor [Aquimixticola soesokkakensis]|uniref:Protease 3 n=1 Tax=Aquimixticola soesokkakensis TaxID=1519096 RepID=A0A1Y5TNE4_9RHOB|nr:pitrilysin family protein [Aquimixticola soesokkakensis]SLN68229.1 Protease 3 precursor [Aquimixticola soesokkakensis]
MRTLTRLASLVLSAGLSLSAAQAATPTTFTLENGMEVVVLEDHRAPVVVNMVWYKVGAADEPWGKSGIAHFLEHLMFKGTDDLAAGELSATVTQNGGSDNAFTSWDYTAYFQRVAADRLPIMIEMEADRMRDLQMSQEDVATEREVVLEERNQRTDSDPGALFSEQRSAAQYLNHPYGIPIIGWRHEVEALSRDDAFDFYAKYYAPNNAILIVAGDVRPEDVKALAEEHFGPLAPTEGLAERVRPSEPPQLSERRLEFSDPRVSQPYLIRTYLAPERNPGAQETPAALALLASLLGGEGATSVLGSKLQFRDRVAIYASAFYDDVALDPSTFGLVMMPTPGTSQAEAEAALDAAIAEFLAEGINDEDFARLKMQMRAARIYEEDDIQSVARRYGAELTSGLTLADVAAWPDILDATTADQVMEAARLIFDERKAVNGWLLPDPETGAARGPITLPSEVTGEAMQ